MAWESCLGSWPQWWGFVLGSGWHCQGWNVCANMCQPCWRAHLFPSRWLWWLWSGSQRTQQSGCQRAAFTGVPSHVSIHRGLPYGWNTLQHFDPGGACCWLPSSHQGLIPTAGREGLWAYPCKPGRQEDRPRSTFTCWHQVILFRQDPAHQGRKWRRQNHLFF